jgi:hypothetical protein
MVNLKGLRIDSNFSVNIFSDEILVKCPNCGGYARAIGPTWDKKDRQFTSAMSCLHCSRQHKFVTDSWDYWNSLPLWLRTPCCGETLWAFNSRHLIALQDYVSAGLRENKLGHYSNRACI